MKKSVVLVSAALLGSVLVGCQSNQAMNESTTTVTQAEKQEMAAVKGTLAYRERIALPPSAIIKVTLEDVSLADAPSTIIATQEFTADGAQVPFDFSLSYDSSEIKANHRYSVRAAIFVDGKLRFTTDTANMVITDANMTKDIDLRLVGTR